MSLPSTAMCSVGHTNGSNDLWHTLVGLLVIHNLGLNHTSIHPTVSDEHILNYSPCDAI